MISTFDLDRLRGPQARVLIVAEAGVNHEGNVETALEMISAAAAAGVDAVKFQTYKAERLATRSSSSYWDETKEPATSQFDLFKRYDRFEPDDYQRLEAACRDHGVLFLTTPFDVDVVDWLDPLQSLWKIASGDLTNVPLLERVGATGKPVLLSTGASTLDEIREAEQRLRLAGSPAVSLLHCTLAYPTAPSDAAIGSIRALAREFPDTVLGYSDHTVPPVSFQAIEAAVTLGARVVEKHYTLDKSLPGNDHYHAFEPTEFAALRVRLDMLHDLLGSSEKTVLPAEQAARLGARRSVVSRGAIPRDTVITRAMLDVKRPGGGIEPRYIDELVGRRAASDIADDTTLEWEMLSADPVASGAR
jgi:N-acetylneuraminate synthase